MLEEIDQKLVQLYLSDFKTCPKGFGLKVAKLRLKTLLKIKEAIGGQSEAIGAMGGNQEVIGGNQGQSEDNQRAIGGQLGVNRGQSGSIRSNQGQLIWRQSGKIWWKSGAIKGNWKQSGAIGDKLEVILKDKKDKLVSRCRQRLLAN